MPPLWIGFENSSGLILAHNSCPFDYCDTNASRFTLNNTEALCRLHRTGILCQRYQQGLSLVFGSFQWKNCTNAYFTLVLVFIIAGVVLVLSQPDSCRWNIKWTDFYANIVKIHQAIVFPASQTNVVTVLLAWLNLDLGIEVCFFEGFDAHTRTWLQYIFPVYI